MKVFLCWFGEVPKTNSSKMHVVRLYVCMYVVCEMSLCLRVCTYKHMVHTNRQTDSRKDR